MANTTNFAIEKPTVGGYRNTWGGTINTGLDKLTELLALALPVGSIQMYAKITAPTATTNGGKWLVCDGASVLRTGSGGYADLFAILGTTYGTADVTHFNLPDLRARVPVGYNASAIGSGVTVRSGRAIASSTGGTEGHIITTGELSAHSHPIPSTVHSHSINDQTHAHAGLRSDGSAGTENATLAITDNGHFHDTPHVKSWGGSAAGYLPEWGPGPEVVNISSQSKTTGISIADHKHTFATDPKPTGITATQDGVINITSTAPDTGSNASHNNMQPYVVVNYIILAKHPTFT